MTRPGVPAVLRDVFEDRTAARTLIVAALSLAAAGLDPHVYNPGLASVQAAIRARPELEQTLMIAAVLGALVMLGGGVLGDTDGRRRIHLAALATLIVTGAAGFFLPDPPALIIDRFGGLIASSIILPFALAGVAVAYEGVARATAIGLAYAAYGGASALGPVLLTLFGPTGPRWPAFVVATIVAVIAFAAARRAWPDLPSPSRPQRRRVIVTAVWAAGIIVFCMGTVGFGHGAFDPLRITFLVAGVVVILAAAAFERGVTTGDDVHVERRPVAMALFVGFVIAFAQATPLLQLPLFFQLLSGYGPVLAVAATIPFVVALVITGPIVGVLLGRVGPRPLITAGVAAVGAGNLLLALALAPRAPYGWFVVPLALIGAGFVVATTVRTAIIFASVPRGLPATAAALNEASVALGTRAGLVLGTLVIAILAVRNFSASLAGGTGAAVDTAIARFNELLVAIGTPGFGALVADIAQPDRAAYATAYTDAVRTVLFLTGVFTIVAAVITWFLVGRRDPLTTVWEHRDERPSPGGVTVPG